PAKGLGSFRGVADQSPYVDESAGGRLGASCVGNGSPRTARRNGRGGRRSCAVRPETERSCPRRGRQAEIQIGRGSRPQLLSHLAREARLGRQFTPWTEITRLLHGGSHAKGFRSRWEDTSQRLF